MYRYDTGLGDAELAGPRRSAPRRIAADLQGVSPNLTHWLQVANIYRSLRRWFPGAAVHVDKNRREHGRPASPLRPDIQFRHPQRRRATHIEVDTEPASMRRHIANSDTRRRSVFVLIDPNTGAVVEKRIYPPGAKKPIIRRGALRRSDVFDESDAAADERDWNIPRRWSFDDFRDFEEMQ